MTRTAREVEAKTAIGKRLCAFFGDKNFSEIEEETCVSDSTVAECLRGSRAPNLRLLQYIAENGGDVSYILTGRPVARREPDDSALRLVLRDWADLSDDDRVRISGEVRQLAAEARAKRGKAVSG